MSAVAEKTLLTPQDLLDLVEAKGFELVDGEFRERRVRTLPSWVAGNLFGMIRTYVVQNELGWVFPPDNGFQCFPDRPNTVRKPDASFIRADRMEWSQVAEGYLRLVPDQVAEVISPNDLEEQIEIFLEVGVPLIWVISPSTRTVRIVRGNKTISILREGDELSGEDVLPGFLCPVAAIFLPRSADPVVEVKPAV